MPHPGSSPTRAWVSANRAFSDAIKMSQLSANSKPPVTHTPLIAPITGVLIDGHRGVDRSLPLPPDASRRVLISFRSMPAQNAGSLPVRITTSTASSASASARASNSLSRNSVDSALRTRGRFSVSVRMLSDVSISSTSAVCSSRERSSPSSAMHRAYRWAYVPKHHGTSRAATRRHRRGDRGRRTPVHPQSQWYHQAVSGQHRRVRGRGGRCHRHDHAPAVAASATQATAQDGAALAATRSARPAKGMTVALTHPALKEWSAAVHGLLDGRQTVLLRKGGIGEKRFEVAADRFLLFPTVAHSHAGRVRAEHQDLLEPAVADSDDDHVVLRAGANVVAAIPVSNPAGLADVGPLHIWTERSVHEDR